MPYNMYLGRGKRSKDESYVGEFEDTDAAIKYGNELLMHFRSLSVRGVYLKIKGETSELTTTETLIRMNDPAPTPRKLRKGNGDSV